MDYLLNQKKGYKTEKLNMDVLNLIINGLPSKLALNEFMFELIEVLNLIINGLPSKLECIYNVAKKEQVF